MTEDIVERVARAVARETYGGGVPGVSLDHEEWSLCMTIARSTLLALREPTEGMVEAAFVAMNETPSGTWKRMKAEKLSPRELFAAKMRPRWTAMIDFALRER